MAARPRCSPHPQPAREGRGWGLRPLPQHCFGFRGGWHPGLHPPPAPSRGQRWSPPGRLHDPDSSPQRPPWQEQQPARRPAATPLASRAWLRPRDPSRPANGGTTNGTTSPSLAAGSYIVLGSTSLEGEAGRRCWRPWGDGPCTYFSLPVSLESPNHSATKWLRYGGLPIPCEPMRHSSAW